MEVPLVMRVIDEQMEITGEESGLIRQIDRRWLMGLLGPVLITLFSSLTADFVSFQIDIVILLNWFISLTNFVLAIFLAYSKQGNYIIIVIILIITVDN